MLALKCKMCGGSIEPKGQTHGICMSCGREVTLPKIDDDRRADLYNRGNHFRKIGEFDRAYSAYEHIIAEDKTDAEAHFCLALCRYGVEYVKDPRTGEYKPTVSRMSYDSVLEDPDYQAAVEYSDEYTARLYRSCMREIAEIQNRYLEIARREQPYDVFICFKAENEDNTRTKGSVLAQDIYEQLAGKGLKVFFSRITLEDKLSMEYEPYIFAALYSAKVMLVVADEASQLQARWVKNEWSRYLGMMEKDRGKSLIPVFTSMSPYDFPPEIPMVQGQDMDKLGAMQDLVRGVLKLVRGDAPVVIKAQQSVQVENLLKRAKQALLDGEFREALDFSDRVLNQEPENGTAYYIQLLGSNRARNQDELLKLGCEWEDNRYLKRAVQYADAELAGELAAFRQACEKERAYRMASKLLGEENDAGAWEILKEIPDYRDSRLLAEQCQARLAKAEADRIRKKNLEQFRRNVGQNYIESRVKESHPKEYAEYKALKSKLYSALSPRMAKQILVSNTFYTLGALVVLLFFGICLLRSVVPTLSPFLSSVSYGFLGLAALCSGFLVCDMIQYLRIKRYRYGRVSRSVKIAVVAVTFVVIYILNSICDTSRSRIVFYGVFTAFGLFMFFKSVCRLAHNLSGSVHYKTYKEETEGYYRDVILPLQEEVRDELLQQYRDKVPEEEIKKIKGFS